MLISLLICYYLKYRKLDEYYGLRESENKEKIETALTLRQVEATRKQFIIIYDQIRRILQESSKNFGKLVCNNTLDYMPRPFQIIFLSFYDLIFREKMEIANYDELIDCLKNINKDIQTRSGPTWSYQDKKRNISKVKGIIRECFKKRDSEDPANDCWITEFETLLTQSKTEQALYDFKQGFIKLDGKGEFDKDNFNKIIKTLTAMANHSPNANGYICVGVADNDLTAKRIEDLYKIKFVEYKKFKITGINHEATRLRGDLDKFYRWIIQEIKSQPIEQSTKDNISRNIKIINYFDKDVVVFCIRSGKEPTTYNQKFYQRLGANVDEIKHTEFRELFRRFS